MTSFHEFLQQLLAMNIEQQKPPTQIGPGVKRSRELQRDGLSRGHLIANHKSGERDQSRYLEIAERRLRRYGWNNPSGHNHPHPPRHLAEKMAILIAVKGAQHAQAL